MPEVSAFCPGCGRAVGATLGAGADVDGVAPLSRDALLGAIAYVAVVPAIIFLLVPALGRFVRFHSWQSLFLAGGAIVVGGVTKVVFAILVVFPFVGFLLAWLVAGVISLAIAFLWIAMFAKAVLGDAYELPLIGRWAAGLANR